MVLTGHQKAYTVARVGAMRVGAFRIAYAPRCTDFIAPDGTDTEGLPAPPSGSVARYPCHKRTELDESGSYTTEVEP